MQDFVLCVKCAPSHRRVLRESCPHHSKLLRQRRILEIPDLSYACPFELPKDTDRLIIADRNNFGRLAMSFRNFLGGQAISSFPLKLREIHFACDGTEAGEFRYANTSVDLELVLARLLALDLSQLETLTLSVPHAGSAPRCNQPLIGVTLAQALHVALLTALRGRRIKVLGLRGKLVGDKWMQYRYAAESYEGWRGLEDSRISEILKFDESIHDMFQKLD